MGIVIFSADRGLDDAALLALVIFFVCNAAGDRVWLTSVRAAARLRLAGAGSLLAGAATALTHLYVERNWILLALALLVISAGIILWVQDLGSRLQDAQKGPGSK